MNTIYQFFRLIRFSNLVVMILTMCFFYGLLSNYHIARQYLLVFEGSISQPFLPSFLERIGLYDTHFLLLLLSVILVAASGNIINDYFDQKADRVNKPNRLIIDKFIKRRWAIILNWSFNALAFLIALYLSYVLDNWWIIIISFGSINLLYFYSAVYKRKFLVGNIIVAFLTSIVPLYVFIYGAYTDFGVHSPFGLNDEVFIIENALPVIGYCGFAFFLNLIREIIKDLADVKGDLLLQSQTLPIRIGISKTKVVVSILFIIVLLPLAYFNLMVYAFGEIAQDITTEIIVFSLLIGGVFITLIVALIVFLSKNTRKRYLLASNLIKIAMLFGVVSALFYFD